MDGVSRRQWTGGGAVGGSDQEHEMSISTVREDPGTVTPVDFEAKERVATPEQVEAVAAAEGFPCKGVEEMRRLLLGIHIQAFRRALSIDLRVAVQHLCGCIVESMRAIGMRPTLMEGDKAIWLEKRSNETSAVL